MLANYQLLIISASTGEQLDLVTNDRIQKLEYTRRLNDIGRFQLTVLASDALFTLRGTVTSILDDDAINTIFEIYRDDGSGFVLEETYLLSYINIFQDENAIDWLVLAGSSALRLLADTLVIPDDDPDEAGGYSTKGGKADSVMRDFVYDQCVSPATNAIRTRAYIDTLPLELVGNDVFARVEYQPLLKTLQDLTVQGNIDFNLLRSTGFNFDFVPYPIGTDLTYTSNYPNMRYLLFSPELGNLRNPNLIVNRDANVTVTYVATQGIQEERIILPVSEGDELLDLNRRESVIDNREIDDDSNLLDSVDTAGAAELRAKQPVITFDFDIDTTASGARYRQDWQLGDKITARYLTYQEDLRIVEVALSVEGSQETITPTFQKLTEAV